MEISHNNFFSSTAAVFKGCKTPKRKFNFISESGSAYWYGEDSIGAYVIRQSDHWVNVKRIGSNAIFRDCDRIASCQWHLKTNKLGLREYAAKAYLKDFKKI